MSIAPNPLNGISRVYLESIAEAKVEPPKDRLKTDRNMFNIPKDEQQAAKERLLAKTAAKRKAAMEALDPVGQEDADIDNDGDTDKSDKYLHKRRKAISAAMKKKLKEQKELLESDFGAKDEVIYEEECEDEEDDEEEEQEDEKKTGKKEVKKKIKENFSNWRQDLSEVMTDEIDSKPIKEKKVNNKITVNPKLSEAVEELGGTLIEMVEIDEFDYVVESVYDELLEEGYGEDDIEEAIEYALTEAKVTFGHDTTKRREDGSMVGAVRRLAKQKLKSFAKKAVVRGARAVASGASKLADKVEGKPTKKDTTYRGQGVGRKEKVGSPTPKASAPAPKSAPKASAPKPKAKPEPKVKAKPKAKKKSNLDDLLQSIRNEETQLDEKITAKTDMGAAIEDFYSSKSPQLAGRTKEERRKAAIAAVLTARRGGKKLGEQMDTEVPSSESGIDKKKDMMDKQKLANMKILQQKQQMLQKQRLQMQKSGRLPLEAN